MAFSRLANAAVASERSKYFSKNHDYNTYNYIQKSFPCRGEHVRNHFGVYKHVTECIRNITRGVDMN